MCIKLSPALAFIDHCVLHQDNVKPHTSPYTDPWIAANDFWLFLRIKMIFIERQYENEENLKHAVLGCLSAKQKKKF